MVFVLAKRFFGAQPVGEKKNAKLASLSKLFFNEQRQF